MIRVADIQRIVAQEHQLPLRLMRGPERYRDAAWARQEAMCLATRLTEHSYTRIGHFFGGRDRTTVLHGMKSAESRCANDDAVKARLRRVTLALLRRAA